MAQENDSSSVPGLALIRQDLNFSQAELARALPVPVAGFTVCTWETGRRTPSVEKLKQIAEFFACRTDDLCNPQLTKRRRAEIRAAYHQREADKARQEAAKLAS